MSDDVRAAAERLIRDIDEHYTVVDQDMLVDALTVARFVLEAVNDRTRLFGAVEALKEALARAHNEGPHAKNCKGRMFGNVFRVADLNHCNCWRSSVRAALDAAPAVAPGASDAGDGSER